ncbi:YaaC family protein [Oceanobacillus sp. FSL K6-2867]|uniref:YaaC family protein n=1 Tax=Oceanobacillus sp. FSL K6-2867 TaxID=2954748 RepID=UPI0030DC03D1
MIKVDEFYTFLNAQQNAQNFLYQCYLGMDDAESKSYQNYSTFMYLLDHSQRFYENGRKADELVQPVLYFYGLVHLLKAYLLTKRPDYPESTTQLAHGVTARKRKKKFYTFTDDEVKVQQHGMFPYFSEHLYSIKRMPFEKIRMEVLFSLLPEMNDFFALQKQEKLAAVGSANSVHLHFPTKLLDNYHLTEKAFIARIQNYLPTIKAIKSGKLMIDIQLEDYVDYSNGPFFKHLETDQLYFPAYRDALLPISEVMIHYLLLFNLSMLCRYESEWWGDLFVSKADMDYPLIHHFLQITAQKIPQQIGSELLAMKMQNDLR